MKELFFIISSKYRRPVPKKYIEKVIEHFRGSKIKPTKYELVASQNKLSVWELCMRNGAAKLTFIILTVNVTFINKSHGDIKRSCMI